MAALDWRAVRDALALPALYWVLAVVVVTVLRYPGVICMTPAAWLLAPSVGGRAARESRSPQPGQRIWEAGLGGALLGLLQGLTFSAALLSAPDLLPVQLGGAAWLSAGVTLGGVVACGLLAAAFGLLVTRRQG